MRLLPVFLLTASFSVHAGEHYVISDGPAAALSAFSRAAHQSPLSSEDTGSVRVWTRDYMQGRVQGFVLSDGSAVLCSMSSTYADGVVSLGRASCRRVRHRPEAVKAINGLPPFSRAEWDCPVFDGGEVYIERMQGSRYSAVRIGNPDACDDPESKAVAAALNDLW